MTREEFYQWYFDFSKTAMALAAKARRESILSLSKDIDNEKADQRDIFHYGLRFVVDAIDPYYFDKVLTNLVEQEKDEYTRTLKKIQKEAVLLIQQGMNAEMVHTVLNSLTDIPLTLDKTPADSASPDIKAICAAAEKQNKPFDFISNCDPSGVLDVLQREQPQTIAHVLSYLEPHQASVLLQFLPPELQGETALRIATMDKVSLEIIRGIERSIKKKLSSVDHYGDAGGTDCILEILELMEKDVSQQIIADIEGKDPELAEYIKGQMANEE